MALQGLMQLAKTIHTVLDRLNPSLEILGVLPCRIDKKIHLSQNIIKKKKDRKKLLPIYIRDSVKIAERPLFAEPITIYNPKGADAEDFGIWQN